MNGHRSAARRSRLGPLLVAAILVVLVLLPALTLGPGAAARLHLEPGSFLSTSVAERCTDSVSATHDTATTGEAITVTVSGLGAPCEGRDLELTLYGTGGEVLTTGTAAVAADTSGSLTMTVPAYTPADVAGAAATIGSWGVPATWTYTLPVQPSIVECAVLNDPTGEKTCAVKDIRIDAWGYPEITNYNLYATVTSPSADQDVEWELAINLADPEFKILANLADSNNGVELAPGWTCSSMPILKLRGHAPVDTQYVGGGKTVTIWVHGRSVSGPSDGGSLYNCS